MKKFRSVTLLAAVFSVCGLANADTSIEMVWECTLKEGKSMEEVHAVNAKWVKFINKKVKGGEISSATVVAVVGDYSSFLFVDSFPNLQSWTDASAVMASSEGQKQEAAFEEVSECSSSRLYESTY